MDILLSLGIGEYIKYLFLVIAIIFTNPLGQLLAASGASLGYFNIFAVFFITIIIEFIVDVFYYTLGKIFGIKVLKIFKVKKQAIDKFSVKIKNNFIKTFFVLKFSGPIALPGLLAIGLSKIKTRRFILASIALTIIKNIILIPLGYYLGTKVNYLIKYLTIIKYIIIFLVIIGILYLTIRKIMKKRRIKIKRC